MANPTLATTTSLEAVKDTAFIIDVREEDEKEPAGLPVCKRAKAIPWKSWTCTLPTEGDHKVPPEGSNLPEDKSAPIITHCNGGGRGGKAKLSLEALGYTNVHNGGGPKGTPELWAVYGDGVADGTVGAVVGTAAQ
mmetsp:Transcript_1479/g.1685  ORF Transcript_1479/g.1685 Transcript_1479/m.1685 type:complete len:136 (+) Transcript_1479:54-461(+)|eukprot:CAMPEP_0197849592 /NCGR_PEP_ID=MMETSP1438-20131217/12680_1 /TAXON_ID=1461541 /ORGANISM="Pterosperma sp., Strain CCMP1384" /LENGTH=135 /DNA_ID=CAMNT_0043462363 /DNA_START=54 /DNA_END=461 /DNA_ORIENTATION=-